MTEDAKALIDRQLDAYNTHDIDAFAECYAEDIVVRDLRTNEVMFSGRDALYERYDTMWKQSPDLSVDLGNRIAIGPFVVDYELVTRDGANSDAAAIYEVKDGVIVQVWFVRP